MTIHPLRPGLHLIAPRTRPLSCSARVSRFGVARLALYSPTKHPHASWEEIGRSLDRIPDLDLAQLESLRGQVTSPHLLTVAPSGEFADSERFNAWMQRGLRRIDVEVASDCAGLNEGFRSAANTVQILQRLQILNGAAGSRLVLSPETLHAMRETVRCLQQAGRAQEVREGERAGWSLVRDLVGVILGDGLYEALLPEERSRPLTLDRLWGIDDFDLAGGYLRRLSFPQFFESLPPQNYLDDLDAQMSRGGLRALLGSRRCDLARQRAASQPEGPGAVRWEFRLLDLFDGFLGNLAFLCLDRTLDAALSKRSQDSALAYVPYLCGDAATSLLPSFFSHSLNPIPFDREPWSIFDLTAFQRKLYRAYSDRVFSDRWPAPDPLDLLHDPRAHFYDLLLADCLMFGAQDRPDRILKKIGDRRPVVRFFQKTSRALRQAVGSHFLSTVQITDAGRQEVNLTSRLAAILGDATLTFEPLDVEDDEDPGEAAGRQEFVS